MDMPISTCADSPVKPAPRGMRVLECRALRGPNLFSSTPMIRIQLDIGAMEAWPTSRIPGFVDRLEECLPGLAEHGCCYQQYGGFLRRLRAGTWIGHVVEHVALELQSLVGCEVSRGKTRSVRGRPGVYNILYAYQDEPVGLLAGRLALELVDALLPADLHGVDGLDVVCDRDPCDDVVRDDIDIERVMTCLRQVQRRWSLGPTTRALVEEARRRGIPVMRLDSRSLFQLGTGRYQRRIRASVTGRTTFIATDAASDKQLTRTLLADAGLPVPAGHVVHSPEEAVAAATRLGGAVVTKPLDANHGRGITIGLGSSAEVEAGYATARQHSRSVIVEQLLYGRDYRVLVVDGEVAAVSERVHAHVVGDGRHTIAELVAEVNRDPRRGSGHENMMTRIEIDACALAVLDRQGMQPESIPHGGLVVRLRDTANLSTGGTAVDCTDAIHPHNAAVACRAARAVGLDVAGVDIVAPDIACPFDETGGGIVEVNAAPGLRMHLQPSQGAPRNVARPIIDMLFPPGTPARIPILAITGTNGKSTTVRMLAHILHAEGLTVGLTTTSGVYIGRHRVTRTDAAGPESARLVLRDPKVDVAVLETARGGILREGLGFDRCDVGCITNIASDHLGLGGIETIRDLASVKSVVVEAVHRGGTSVLNADDPYTTEIRRRARGRLAFVSMLGGAQLRPELKAHIENGGLAVVRDPGSAELAEIVLYENGKRSVLMRAADIPATLHGLAEFNVANALCAVAMAAAHGVSCAAIRTALSTFTCSFDDNPGRLNIHDGHGFRVILDYAHNPAGLSALGELLAKLRYRHGRSIALLSMPGDRRDDDIRELGRVAARFFDDLVLREDRKRRGRAVGEIVGLIAEGALTAGCSEQRITRHLGEETEAAEECLRRARPGDLVVLTPTDVEAMWKRVVTFTPQQQRLTDSVGAEHLWEQTA